MTDPRTISIDDYSYNLPEDRIAPYPTNPRDASKLLMFKRGKIEESRFGNIASLLPPGSLTIFNDTRVVEARLIFQKSTGARIEIFCLEPGDDYPDLNTALSTRGSVLWKCLVGNASSWNKTLVLEKEAGAHILKAEMVSKEGDHFLIKLSWQPETYSFADILHDAGIIPLPPYIKRKVELTDAERYQTVYAGQPGSVAAPTAGLHFTPRILDSLQENKIRKDFVTLHVGAGTFKPVKTALMQNHEMHAEFIEIKKSLVENIYNNLESHITAVGTTSLRTLESIYWIGVKILSNKNISHEELHVQQWDPYAGRQVIGAKESLQSVMEWMQRNAIELLVTKTSLLIAPSYKFKIVNILITNFHQPQSTLLLLVAAFIGNKWKDVYEYALENNFRFLSYGDACLLFRD